MKFKFRPYLEAVHKKIQPQLDNLLLRLQPVREYWKRLTERDQQILLLGGMVLALLLIFSVISAAIDYRQQVKGSYLQLERYRIDAQLIASNYKELANLTPNDFSSVNTDRIKGDSSQIMEVTDADVVLADNTLTVKANNVKFEAAMNFLDQLRKSYGLFPEKLKITRLSQSGYVAFSATFTNVEQQ